MIRWRCDKNSNLFRNLAEAPFFDSEIIKMAQTYAKGKENLTFAEVAREILLGAASGMEIEEEKK